jgi:hypothetical protein
MDTDIGASGLNVLRIPVIQGKILGFEVYTITIIAEPDSGQEIIGIIPLGLEQAAIIIGQFFPVGRIRPVKPQLVTQRRSRERTIRAASHNVSITLEGHICSSARIDRIGGNRGPHHKGETQIHRFVFHFLIPSPPSTPNVKSTPIPPKKAFFRKMTLF